MQPNIGRMDAWIRGACAVVLLIVATVFNEQVVISLVAAVFALLFAATALTHSCPLYTLLHLDTRTHDSHPQQH
jgi:hypothetical protein